MITVNQAKRFIKVRERSGLNSNLQFTFDCREAGFKLTDLGDVAEVSPKVYVWTFPWGKMIEEFGHLRIEPKQAQQ